jgi:electron transfer flavoprotein beta subunit
MDIVVPIKFVPDPVEELEIDADTGLLDRMFVRLIPNELDEHALEQALLIKERSGATVTVIALDTGDVDETLFTAKARGADRLIKIVGDGLDEGVSNHAAATLLQPVLAELPCDLIITGTQAVDDLDGYLGAVLAARLGLPYVGYVVAVTVGDGCVTVSKEYPGGVLGRYAVQLPAVLGIQAAEQPPRYVVTSLVMEAMKTATIEEVEAGAAVEAGPVFASAMNHPEAGARAEMFEGDPEQIAASLVALMREKGVVG